MACKSYTPIMAGVAALPQTLTVVPSAGIVGVIATRTGSFSLQQRYYIILIPTFTRSLSLVCLGGLGSKYPGNRSSLPSWTRHLNRGMDLPSPRLWDWHRPSLSRYESECASECAE
jgi:hypothetical protein